MPVRALIRCGIWTNRFLLNFDTDSDPDPDFDFDLDNGNRECLLLFGIPCRMVDNRRRIRAGW